MGSIGVLWGFYGGSMSDYGASIGLYRGSLYGQRVHSLLTIGKEKAVGSREVR